MQFYAFADRAQIKAGYLIDPVDNTDFTRESADYPSAVRALLQSGQAVGITGAGIVGRCNPNGSNYKVRVRVYGYAAVDSLWSMC